MILTVVDKEHQLNSFNRANHAAIGDLSRDETTGT